MELQLEVQAAIDDPERLEHLYRQAVEAGEEAAFREAVEALYAAHPEHVLLAAWHYRLAAEPEAPRARAMTHWRAAVAVAVVNALAFWALSDFDRLQYRNAIPHFFLLWAPITAGLVLIYLYVVSHRARLRLAALLVALAVSVGYVYAASWWIRSSIFWHQYLVLGAIHLVLIAWAAVGLFVLRGQGDVESRFAFLLKSLEAAVVGGLFVIVLGIFSSITFALFDALRVSPPDVVVRLFFVGGSGLVPPLAVAMVYDPRRPRREQNVRAGGSGALATLLRVFVPLSILVLLVYIGFIPFRFTEPFYNRDVLVVYNVMLFAVVALLLGATPAPGVALSERQARWLRRGLVTLAALTLVVSLYALAAIIFRTWWDGFTPNRITVIGWNVVNIAFLALLLYRQAQCSLATWTREMWRNFAWFALVYPAWGVALMALLPLVF